jgi:tRNA-dihydrouridine synthase
MRCAQLLSENVDFDFLDINCGCPIDLVFNKVGQRYLLDSYTSWCVSKQLVELPV